MSFLFCILSPSHTPTHTHTPIPFYRLIFLPPNSLWGDQGPVRALVEFRNLPVTCGVCGWSGGVGGGHHWVFDWRWLQSQPLCPTWVLPLYGESRLICQVLTSVSSVFWVVSPHPSWLRLLKPAVQQSHLFQLPVEIGWLETKRGHLLCNCYILIAQTMICAFSNESSFK